VNALLFIATIVSVMMAGLSPEMRPNDPRWYFSGLSFAAALMGILVAHEMAHYVVSRRYGSPTSLPYFIPLPIVSIFGTMGAVIFQYAPMRNRRALFDIGIAGPLAGLIVAIPLLILGLKFSQVGRASEFMDLSEGNLLQEGNSLTYIAAKYLVFGRVLPDQNGEDVWLSLPASPGGPVAFAAWVGLFVTAINLLPIGQLDGGHVAYALLGKRAWKLAYGIIGFIGVLALYLGVTGNPAAMTWGLLVGLGLLVGPRHPPPLNDASSLGRNRTLLGILLALIFIAIFVPIPVVIAP
jgi:membrane-associated protease RseP (regulator of RpoE activity)